ncbi:GTP-binding protein [Croceitalea rosinachiae]|uniref:GTP-binding protein n=1 Tax=Croceitalea rosinachiae TaxID=3075596 RepID=A0ABU3AB91_9FLAO|nr:GTP-binding protein [Croceitalea sp. F388]MDT0606812.1 GTP-binding protein [Croceitalea sp. F388]
MSDLGNEIVLRPRFEISLVTEIEKLMAFFDQQTQNPFVIKRIDEHIYIRFRQEETTFWSPQLHIELTSFEKGITKIQGLFGPNPTLWTFFMFLHFGVGTLFVIIGVFAYSKYSLGQDITVWIVIMILLTLLWFVLYAFGRLGKSKGKAQMKQLKVYFDQLVSDFEKSKKGTI